MSLDRVYLGGDQNYGPFLDPQYTTAPNIQGTQKGTIILTTTHFGPETLVVASMARVADQDHPATRNSP